MTKPVIVVVDDQVSVLQHIESDRSTRCGAHYDVVSERSTAAACFPVSR